MANILVTQKDSIVDQLEQLHQRIARRAYDLFRSRDGWGDEFGDWLSAEAVTVRPQRKTASRRRGRSFPSGAMV